MAPSPFYLCLLLLSTVAAASSSSDASDASDDENTVTNVLGDAGDLNIGASVIAGIAIVVGIGMTFSGYRLFRLAMFITGFVGGGYFIAWGIEEGLSSKSWVVEASWVGFFLGGLVVGSLVLVFYHLGIFAGGAGAGVLLAYVLNTAVGHKIYSDDPTIVFIVMAVIFGVLLGILAIMVERPALIITTSFVGAGLFIWGIGYFAGDFPSGDEIKSFRLSNVDEAWIDAIPDAWWGYFSALIVLSVIGAVVQFRQTPPAQFNYTRGRAGWMSYNRAVGRREEDDDREIPYQRSNMSPRAMEDGRVNGANRYV